MPRCATAPPSTLVIIHRSVNHGGGAIKNCPRHDFRHQWVENPRDLFSSGSGWALDNSFSRRATTTADAISDGRIAIGYEGRRGLSKIKRLAGSAVLSAGEEARRDHAVKAFGEQHAVGRLVEHLRAWV